MIVKIKNCPRCEFDHEVLESRKMVFPFVPSSPGPAWTHWASCPMTGDPILIMIVKKGSSD